MVEVIPVSKNGVFVRGIAVPWGRATVVSSSGPNGQIVHLETFDRESIPAVGSLFGKPLLLAHDSGRPVGLIHLSRSTQVGLEIEAQLVGSEPELEGIRRRLAAGLQSGLSIGFFPDRKSDIWTRPENRSGMPLVLRRNVELREVSLVMWGAYPSAQVTGVHDRTSLGELRHEKSQRIIDEWNTKKAAKRGREILEAKYGTSK